MWTFNCHSHILPEYKNLMFYSRMHTIQCKQEKENALVPNLNSLLDSFELK